MRRLAFELDLFYCLVVIGVVVLIGIIAAKDCKARRACEEGGGTVVETNCRTRMRCTTMHGNNNSSTTECEPYTTCDWKCIYPTAERP